MPIIAWPPVMQTFMRGKTWWRIISTTPFDITRYLVHRQPILGAFTAYGCYYYFWQRHYDLGIAGRYERYKQNFRADLHMQENIDWKSKDSRDGMQTFVESQITKHGSFEAAVKSYCDKTGVPVPTLLVDDAVLDQTLRRVGIPVDGPSEPQFLWDGTPWTTEKPETTPDGKRSLPQAPTFYKH